MKICNRPEHEEFSGHLRNITSRYVLGFQRYDKVLWQGQECFVFGRRTKGYLYLRKLDGTKVHGDAPANRCRLLESARTFLVERRSAVSSPA
jgi:hypothetical protein